MKLSTRNFLVLAASVLTLFGAYAATVTILLSGATATGAGAAFSSPQGLNKTYQAYGRTEAGTGTAAISIEGSNDGTHWDTVTTTSLSLTSATLEVSAGMTATDRYAFARANVTALSGSTPTVSVTRSY